MATMADGGHADAMAQSGAAAGAAGMHAQPCYGGTAPRYPSASEQRGDTYNTLHAKIAALELKNKRLEQENFTLRSVSSAWGNHTCDGCGTNSGSVRFRCVTCPDRDFCMACIETNNKFCNHAMQVHRGGFVPKTTGSHAQGASHGYGVGVGFARPVRVGFARTVGVGFARPVGVGLGPVPTMTPM